MLRSAALACGTFLRHFKGLKPINFPLRDGFRTISHSTSEGNVFSSGDVDTDGDDIIEIFDLPTVPQFEENPEFEYVSHSSIECRYPFISNKRSRGGVFNLPEVVQFLRAENFSDIVSIRIPEAACYGDFMVIATGKSDSHVVQASKILHELFKMKRAPSDSFPSFEGLKEHSEWVAVDLEIRP
ncbi:Mitochondrial assembly of ribosomal large subunit protein 1 [Taenia crassiceps]|uniref:Mitochondrial assembly of ribosomal large subunit protein 1 n=1 Tax=Taenia crassiceps TaxID=6207 RepID=A0ABR4QQK0_9CEST